MESGSPKTSSPRLMGPDMVSRTKWVGFGYYVCLKKRDPKTLEVKKGDPDLDFPTIQT